MTGGENSRFTPVVFSFGWVAYAFQCLVSALGDGDFMPKPEQSSWVVNLWSGDRRQNQSWVLGRLIRDLEFEVNKKLKKSEKQGPFSLLVTVYKISARGRGPKNPKKDWVWVVYFFVVAAQMVIAAIPLKINDWNDWSILLVVGVGNILALLTSSLPAMRTQKYQLEGKTGSESYYALTRGNGHQHVFIILPNAVRKNGLHEETRSRLPHLDHMATARHRADSSAAWLFGVLAGLWTGLLIFVGGLDQHTWFLVGAGLIGLLHNIGVSAYPRDSHAHGIPLEAMPEGDHEFGRDDEQNVQQVLRHLESIYPRAGHALKPIFIPGYEPDDDTNEWRKKEVSFQSRESRFNTMWLRIYPRHGSPGNVQIDQRNDSSTVEGAQSDGQGNAPPQDPALDLNRNDDFRSRSSNNKRQLLSPSNDKKQQSMSSNEETCHSTTAINENPPPTSADDVELSLMSIDKAESPQSGHTRLDRER